MTLKILNEIHPLIEEAWHMGFDPILDQTSVVVIDAVPVSGEENGQREQFRSDLERRIRDKEAEVCTYLRSLDGLRVKIDSKILGETIWIVGKKEMLSGLPHGAVGYFPQEVMRIKKAKWTDECLRKIHQIKKVFGGSILDVQRKPTD